MKKKLRNFVNNLDYVFRSDVIFALLIQKVTENYFEGKLSKEMMEFNIRKITDRRYSKHPLGLLNYCVGRHKIEQPMHDGIIDFIAIENDSESLMQYKGEYHFSKHSLLVHLLLYNNKIKIKEIEQFLSILSLNTPEYKDAKKKLDDSIMKLFGSFDESENKEGSD